MIGAAWPEGGVETASITDLNLVLGRLNPDYFLGGEVQLDSSAPATRSSARSPTRSGSGSSRRPPG